MNTQNPLLHKSLLALIIGAVTAAPVFAQQQSAVEPPQLEQGEPATEQVDDIDLNVSPSATNARLEDQSQAPQPGQVGEDPAVSEAAVDLNADSMAENRAEERTDDPNTLRFGGDNVERPASVPITETTTETTTDTTADAADNPTNQSQTAESTSGVESGEPADAENPTEGIEPEEPEVATETAPAQQDPVAQQPKRIEGVYPLPIEDLSDRHVVNSAGQMLGEVETAVVNEASGDAGLVVSVGNLTGIGSAQALAPADQLLLSGDVLIWHTPHGADQITEVQAYNPGEYREIVGSYDSLDEASRELSEPEN